MDQWALLSLLEWEIMLSSVLNSTDKPQVQDGTDVNTFFHPVSLFQSIFNIAKKGIKRQLIAFNVDLESLWRDIKEKEYEWTGFNMLLLTWKSSEEKRWHKSSDRVRGAKEEIQSYPSAGNNWTIGEMQRWKQGGWRVNHIDRFRGETVGYYEQQFREPLCSVQNCI